MPAAAAAAAASSSRTIMSLASGAVPAQALRCAPLGADKLGGAMVQMLSMASVSSVPGPDPVTSSSTGFEFLEAASAAAAADHVVCHKWETIELSVSTASSNADGTGTMQFASS